ncbi:MAG: hypothetical protein JW798_07935 [Prolixibacteraceae bacterium]|nr:hypothetical protein [Prolixibacteraceae bacterium]
MNPFNPYKREHNLHWTVLQMRTLLGNTLKLKSSTYISYAALEARMIIERVEFEILAMAALLNGICCEFATAAADMSSAANKCRICYPDKISAKFVSLFCKN